MYVYIAVSLLALFAIWLCDLDSDPGGYVDSFFYIDKLWHFLGGFLIQIIAVWLFGCSPESAIVLNILNGLAFEKVQQITGKRKGFWNYAWRDWVADTYGIVTAYYLLCLIQYLGKLS